LKNLDLREVEGCGMVRGCGIYLGEWYLLGGPNIPSNHVVRRIWHKRSLESRVRVNREVLSLCYLASDLCMIHEAPLLRHGSVCFTST
jgi:hypothetical protein